MFESIVTWLTETILHLGYPGILVLMAIESSVFPLPSEVVMPPAGYLAAQGRMSAVGAVLAGLAGSILGALFNYYVAVVLGRPLLHRYHRFLLIRETSLDRAEEFFRSHGEISTFVGRLIPVIRHLISLPAGLSRMRLDRFAFYTGLGAGIWCMILTAIGWVVGRNASLVSEMDDLARDPVIHRYVGTAGLVVVPVLVLIVAVYVLRHRRRRGTHGQPSGTRAGEIP